MLKRLAGYVIGAIMSLVGTKLFLDGVIDSNHATSSDMIIVAMAKLAMGMIIMPLALCVMVLGEQKEGKKEDLQAR